MVDWLALGFSVVAIVVTLLQFLSERRRCRKEATIHAFDELERNVFSKEEYKKVIVREGTTFALNQKTSADISAWNNATLALSQIEHFSVGVNSKLYDLKTLNRMAGGFLIKEFERWKPIIDTKRIQMPEEKHYDEFEQLYTSLTKLRKQK